jgi:CPA2 family monovalent cation:H+ antiporter-2
MLLEPGFVLDNAGIVLLLLATMMIGKTLILGGAMLAMGANYRVSTRAALLLAQMGEFSFVLTGVGLADGIIDSDQYGFILAVALASILLTPLLMAADARFVSVAGHLPGIGRRETSIVGDEPQRSAPEGGVVICGYGRVGTVLGEVLTSHNIPFTVIELNPVIVRNLRDAGIPAYYGDSASPELLRRAGVDRATVFVITLPDAVSAQATVHQVRRLKPNLHIVTRASARQQVPVLQGLGADVVIQPEIEAGLQCVSGMLQALGMPEDEIESLVSGQRQRLYRNAV